MDFGMVLTGLAAQVTYLNSVVMPDQDADEDGDQEDSSSSSSEPASD